MHDYTDTAADNVDQEVPSESPLRGWLTLSETAAVTGLTEAHLLRQRVTQGDIMSTLYKGQPLFEKPWVEGRVKKAIAGRLERQERAAYRAKKKTEKKAEQAA